MTGKILSRSCIKHADLVPNRRVFDYDADEPNETNSDESNADEDQSPNTENSDGCNKIHEIVHRYPSLVHFKAVNTNKTYEEIIEYNTILDRVEKVDGEDSECHFRSIDAYQVPLQTTDPAYRGSRWNVRVTWENGEVTYVPLSVIAKSDPVSCTIHAK